MSAHPFNLKKDQRRKKEEKGGGAALPGAAAAGAPAGAGFDSGAAVLSTIGRASPTGVAQTGLWDALVTAVARATGLSAVAAGKAAVVALVVGASSLAAGLSMLIGGSTSSAGPSLGPRVFAAPDESELGAKASPSAVSGGESGAAPGSSLEFVSQANAPAPEPPTAPERAVDAPAAPAAVKTAAAPDHTAPAAAPAQHIPVPHPPLAKRGMPETRGNPGGSARLEPLASLSGKVGGGFQDVYRPKTGAFDAMGTRTRYGANRRYAVTPSGSNSLDQLRFANRLSKSGARMTAGTAAAHTASQPFDGGNMGARALGATRPGGTSLGGTGVSSSANSLLDSKSVQPPPAPESKKNENKTSYQGLVMAAIAALMIGTVLLMIAGQLAKQGKVDPSKLQAAKALAAAAMGAGGVAAGLGGVLAGQYGQMTQGMPFIMGGGILAVQAAMVLAKDEQSGSDAQEGIGNAAGQAASAAGQALSGMNNNNNSNSNSSPSPRPAPRTNVNRTDTGTTYHGSLPQ